MASIVTADGPPSTSRSVAARTTAARLRATRASTIASHRSGDNRLTGSMPVDGAVRFMEQYDTVSYC